MLALCTLRHDGYLASSGDGPRSAGAGDGARSMRSRRSRVCERVAVGMPKPWSSERHEIEAADETDLAFEGLCAFADPPKATAAGAITRLAAAGVRLKILSGDDPIVVKRLADLVRTEGGQSAVWRRCRCPQRRRAGRAGPVDRRLRPAGPRPEIPSSRRPCGRGAPWSAISATASMMHPR